ncbi:MAG: type II toxin-antitoxin system RelE/ParE family toxin [Gammaproteobacteria bacterium]
MIRRIKHKGLKRLYDKGDRSGFNEHDGKRLRQILARMDAADTPAEMDLPGLHFHRLRGNRRGTFAVTVRANYRVTWRMDADGAFVDVDYEDYH